MMLPFLSLPLNPLVLVKGDVEDGDYSVTSSSIPLVVELVLLCFWLAVTHSVSNSLLGFLFSFRGSA